MTAPGNGYESLLERALRSEADSIEPATDGLERIRERLSTPHPLALAWLFAIPAVARRALGWLGSVFGWLADLLLPKAERLGSSVRPAAARLQSAAAPAATVAGDALRPVLSRLPARHGKPGHASRPRWSGARWLHPSAGMAAVAAVIAIGVIAGLTFAVPGFYQNTGNPGRPASNSSPGAAGHSGKSHSSGPGGSTASTGASAAPTPSTTCPSSAADKSPAPGKSHSPKPTPSVTPTSTPTSTPSPSVTPSSSPSTTPSTSATSTAPPDATSTPVAPPGENSPTTMAQTGKKPDTTASSTC